METGEKKIKETWVKKEALTLGCFCCWLKVKKYQQDKQNQDCLKR